MSIITNIIKAFTPAKKQDKIYMTHTQYTMFMNRAKHIQRMAKKKVLQDVLDRETKPLNNFITKHK